MKQRYYNSWDRIPSVHHEYFRSEVLSQVSECQMNAWEQENVLIKLEITSFAGNNSFVEHYFFASISSISKI